MKKTIFAVAGYVIAAAALTGCSIYDKIGKTPDEIHDIAVQKVSEYAEDAVNKKIERAEYLTEEGKVQLKAEVAKLKQEILDRIAEIKAKTDAAKKISESAKTDGTSK